jgi:CheY-like chemotaxis protein
MSGPEDKTVLIVDDEPDVVDYFAGILERAGFDVVTASNGREALDCVKEKKPDFISLDLVMPEKSGIRFLYELRKNREWARIPIMIVTAHARDDLGRKDFEEIFSDRTAAGPMIYLEKPVKPERFLNNVKRILGLAPLEEEPSANDKKRLRDEIAARLGELDAEALKRLRDQLE